MEEGIQQQRVMNFRLNGLMEYISNEEEKFAHKKVAFVLKLNLSNFMCT